MRTQSFLRFGGSVAVSLSLLWAASGCRRDVEDHFHQRPRPVKAVRLDAALGQVLHTFPGTAKAVRVVDLSFRVGGPLLELNLDAGEWVEQGEVVARIDPRDFQVRVESTRARLAASRAKLVEAELQYRRYSNLIQENAAAKAAYDRIKAAYEMASAQMEADTRGLEDAENALADAVLTAPFSGYVDNKYVEDHETVSKGQPVISLVDLSKMEVEISLPEDLLSRVSGFKAFSCQFDAFPGIRFEATFKEIGKSPNPSNRSYPLTLNLVEVGETGIRPGMASEVTITESGSEAGEIPFVVPVTAVVNGVDHQSFVWIFNPTESEVVRQPVRIGSLLADGIEVHGNLRAGQWIVVAGAHSLEEHQKVRLMESPSDTNVGHER